MLLNNKIIIKWNPSNKKYYESLGYKFTKKGDEFEININHLSPKSTFNVDVKCDFCNKKYSAIYYNYIKGRKSGEDCCKECLGKKSGKNQIINASKNGNSLKEKLPNIANEWNYNKNKLTPNDYSYKSNQRVWWVCSEGHEWKTSIISRNTSNCPKCNKESKGETKIREYLEINNVNFKQQYSFKNLLSENNYKLKFDFAIFEDNKLSCLIEYDGEQHYKPNFGEESLNTTKYRDNLKDSYCIDNNIKLLRIPYWELNNIENILNEVL